MERQLTEPTVSLKALLTDPATDITGHTPVNLPTYVDEILSSGFPGIRPLPERARAAQLDSHIARIVNRELSDNGVVVRRPATPTAWLAAYAAATDATYTAILDAATPGENDKPSRSTVDNHRDHLTRLFMLDPVPAWIPAFNPLTRLTWIPKHHLVDPALAARLVGVDREALLQGKGGGVGGATGTWLGSLFESLTTQSLRICADAVDARIGHLRTKDTAREMDLIFEGQDRRVVAIAVKLTSSVTDNDVRHLNWLRSKLGERLVNRVVGTTGPYAYRRPDGVVVAPLTLLGP